MWKLTAPVVVPQFAHKTTLLPFTAPRWIAGFYFGFLGLSMACITFVWFRSDLLYIRRLQRVLKQTDTGMSLENVLLSVTLWRLYTDWRFLNVFSSISLICVLVPCALPAWFATIIGLVRLQSFCSFGRPAPGCVSFDYKIVDWDSPTRPLSCCFHQVIFRTLFAFFAVLVSLL